MELTDILGVYSNPQRDPRGHIMSTVFIGQVLSNENAKNRAKAQDDASELEWIDLSTVDDKRLAFDHKIKMQEIAEEMGLKVVYDDTDSLFIDICNNNCEERNTEMVRSETCTQVNNNIITERVSKFRKECNKRLGVEVEHAKTYKTCKTRCSISQKVATPEDRFSSRIR